MPPKKKVPARRASGKRVQIGESSIIPSPTTSPSGRSLRQAAVGISYKLTRDRVAKTDTKTSQGTQDVTPASPKRRGRPPATASVQAPAPKADPKSPRGRPKRIVDEPAPAETPKSTKRKREIDEEPAADPPKKRGRPPKAAETTLRKPLAKKVEKKPAEPQAKPTVRKNASRTPVKAASRTIPKAANTSKVVAKRGRPAGSTNTKAKDAPIKATKPKAPKKSTKAASKASAHVESEEEFVEGLTQPDEQGAAEFQYWLMKAEPDSRIEKGVDVAYPIDKLAAATEPEPWDGMFHSAIKRHNDEEILTLTGVRNAVARNNMRAMRKGDLAFFYHSNCPVPGIVGVMRIAEEHSVDESAFDPTHPYYDEKSNRDKPKWDCVKVEFVKKFQDMITLKEVKSNKHLQEMQLASNSYGRLSVQSVTPAQWQYVLKMANEPEDLGVTSAVSGYEADTNGETDKEVVEDSIGAEDDDVDVDAEKIAAYGDLSDAGEDDDEEVDMQLNGTPKLSFNKEIQAEKDRVGELDLFAQKVPAVGEV